MTRGDGLRMGRALLVLLGIWLVSSPWIFGYARQTHALEDTIVGLLVVVAGIVSMVMGPATSVPLWTAVVLGIWTSTTPMRFGQAGWSFSANNDLIVGLLITLAAAIALVSRARLRLTTTNPEPHAAEDQTSLW